ncbi:MAG: hypothetical protein SF052_22375 [Bacteroidia bacterium]|nr:hypothetical protein [Bacteroidia bacterium]
MSSLKFPLWLFVLTLNAVFLPAQTDDLELMFNTPSSSSSIELKIVQGGNVSFQVNSIAEYQNGVSARSLPTFEVNSTVNFRVQLSATPFVNAWGHALDANNFGYRVNSIGLHKTGRNFKMFGTGVNPSKMQLLGQEAEIITSHAQGNAGNGKKNRFELHFELGTADVRTESGLPSLLEQKIHLGSYSSAITLVAFSEP